MILNEIDCCKSIEIHWNLLKLIEIIGIDWNCFGIDWDCCKLTEIAWNFIHFGWNWLELLEIA